MEKKRFNAYSIFLKFFRNEASEEESQELLTWLADKKENREVYFQAKRVWTEGVMDEAVQESVDHSWERLQYRLFGSEAQRKMVPGKRHTDWRIYTLVASVAVLLMFSVFTTIRLDSIKNYSERVNQIEVPFGSRTNIILPDGTKVWLNSGSKLSYAQAYFKEDRQVTLNGEAFFDVAKHMGTPFIVHTKDLDVKALGTKFNVKAYPDENIVETYLVEGKVVVDNGNRDNYFEPVTLRPTQKLTYVKEDAETGNEKTTERVDDRSDESVESKQIKAEEQIKISRVSHPETDISWKDEQLVIRSETLSSMSRKLERFFNITIKFADTEVENYMFSGTLDEVTIDEVMKAISSAAPISYEIEKNTVTLWTAR